MPNYEVTLEGFTAHNETWDHIFQVDGKRDEVYIHSDVRLIDNTGRELFWGQKQTAVLGDRNGYPYRVQAGTASSSGGIRTGDHVPYAAPWQRKTGLQVDRPPMVLWSGDLTEQTAVAITPTIWEWDGGQDLFKTWGRVLVEKGPVIARSVGNLLTAVGGKPVAVLSDAVMTNVESGLNALFTTLTYITGQAGDRPIGTEEVNGQAVFKPVTLALNSKLADMVIANNFGYGNGIVGIQYRDSSRLAGNYMLYIKVVKK
ncbi:hypothetical protein A8F94_14410 [Bacillus sp. FJAT-27225]|uniref:hypothetical protein n=1 Tax=Bacillus sp. FJAT-27225 TaxID=1743144 RepID=UPI00080C2886|nr:hypothetical protein [Bacillus sp. FJAT-27225]OCA86032.1 hypothetical protein A8F94_14410 [Bacillus sp. FJAT-27225]